MNTARVDKLLKIFPQAKFIHIYRNPYIVFLSTKKFFIELLPTLWFHEVTEEFIEQLILDVYDNLYQDFYEKRALLNKDNFFEMRFEEFEKSPLEYIERIYEILNLGDFEKEKIHFHEYLRHQKGYKKNKYQISRRELDQINEKWSVYFDKWNYSIPKEIIVN